MAGQTFNPTTSRFLRKVDGKEQFISIEKVTPEKPYRQDGTFEQPYEGDWKSTLPGNLGWNFKMRNGSLEIYATPGNNIISSYTVLTRGQLHFAIFCKF